MRARRCLPEPRFPMSAFTATFRTNFRPSARQSLCPRCSDYRYRFAAVLREERPVIAAPFRQTKALGHQSQRSGFLCIPAVLPCPQACRKLRAACRSTRPGFVCMAHFLSCALPCSRPRDKGNRKGRLLGRPSQVKRALVPAHRKPRLWQNTPAAKSEFARKALAPGSRKCYALAERPSGQGAARSREDRPPRTCHSPCSSIL